MDKKIWMINHYAVTPQLPGGTRHYEFGKQLAARGYDVTIWLSFFHHGLRKYIDRPLRNKINEALPRGLALRWVWSSPYSGNNALRALNMLVFFFLVLGRGIFAPRPGVIMASSPHLLTGLAGWLLSRVKRCRFILEIRDLWPDGFEVAGYSKKSFVYKAVFILANFLYGRSDRIIVLTEGIRDGLLRQGIEGKKIVYLPNGISLDYLNEKRDRDETREGLGFGGKYVCIYAGAHGPNNALGTVLEAAALLKVRKEIMFALLGDGPEKPGLIALAEEKKLTNVKFLDPVPKQAVLPILSSADAAVLSMKTAGIAEAMRPNKLFDYMAAGLPVICAGHGETRRLIENLRLGVCSAPEDPVSLAEAVVTAYENRHILAANAASTGPAYIEQHASREKMVDLLEKEITGPGTPKVLIITSHGWDDPRIFYKQARSLAANYSVELHAPGKGKPFKSYGVDVFPLPVYSTPYLRPVNWLRLFYRGLRSNAQIIHLHDPELLPVALALKIFKKKKVIYDVHEDFSASLSAKPWLPPGIRSAAPSVFGRAEKWLARHVDALVFAEEYYSELYQMPRVLQIKVLNYPLRSGSVNRRFKNGGIFNMVYAGAVSKPRGAIQMVRSLTHVNWQGKDFRLYLVGPVRPNGLKTEIEALAEQLGLTGKLLITGRISPEEVIRYYYQADLGLALLHPEKNYLRSMATKIFEYMAAGLPVLVSDFPAWCKLVEESRCGFTVNPLDEKAIARRIEELLFNIEMRVNMGNSGYKCFNTKYNWEGEEKKLLFLYQKLLSPERGCYNGG